MWASCNGSASSTATGSTRVSPWWCWRSRCSPPRRAGSPDERRPDFRRTVPSEWLSGGSRSAAEVDQVEGGVVVGGVVVLLALLTGHDAAGATRGRTGRDDGVLVVIAARLAGQDAFTVREDDSVLRVRERPALVDQVEGVVRLGGQGVVADAADGVGRGVRAGGGDGAAHEKGGQQKGGGTDAS